MVYRTCSPVRNDCQKGAKNRPNPVDPVVGWETASNDSRSKGTGWVNAGCCESYVSNHQDEEEGC